MWKDINFSRKLQKVWTLLGGGWLFLVGLVELSGLLQSRPSRRNRDTPFQLAGLAPVRTSSLLSAHEGVQTWSQRHHVAPVRPFRLGWGLV